MLTPRRDGWTRGFAIVDLHQSEGRLLKSSRHKLFFPEQIFKWRSRRCCLIWRAIVFWSGLSLKPERFTAKTLEKLVNGEDVFIIQPTGSGKSLIYQSLPMAMAIDIVKETTFKSIAVVISPLTSLMQDQVKFLKSIAAEFIGEDQNNEGGRLPDRVWTNR